MKLQGRAAIQSPFRLASAAGGPDLLVCEPLTKRGLPHGFSFRWRRLTDHASVPFGLPMAQDGDRRALARRFGLNDVVHMRQVHGDKVEVVSDARTGTPTCDGLITHQLGIGLIVQTADCVPILMWDAKQNVVAAVHAGWRGTLAGVAGQALAALQSRFASRPEFVHTAMGPAIGPCCYEVGEEVTRAFEARFPDAERWFSTGLRGGKHLDLVAANRSILVDSGVPAHQVYAAALCTSCRTDMFYSYRKEGRSVGRLLAIVGKAD